MKGELMLHWYLSVGLLVFIAVRVAESVRQVALACRMEEPPEPAGLNPAIGFPALISVVLLMPLAPGLGYLAYLGVLALQFPVALLRLWFVLNAVGVAVSYYLRLTRPQSRKKAEPKRDDAGFALVNSSNVLFTAWVMYVGLQTLGGF
jgi:NADH:ubiquinone oxidoreductase subunit 2 (subunit N)